MCRDVSEGNPCIIWQQAGHPQALLCQQVYSTRLSVYPTPSQTAELLEQLQVVWGKPPRPEWGQALEITPRTVHAMSVTVSLSARSLCYLEEHSYLAPLSGQVEQHFTAQPPRILL